MNIVTPTPMPESGLPALETSINKTANKIPSVVSAITYLFNQNNSMERRFLELESRGLQLETEKAEKIIHEKFRFVKKRLTRDLVNQFGIFTNCFYETKKY